MSEGTSWLAEQGLTEADLDANRRGQLTEVQAERIRREGGLRARLILIAVVFGGVGGCISVAIRAADARSLMLAIPVMLGVAGGVGYLVHRYIRGRFDREAAGAVVAVEGTVTKTAVAPRGFLAVVDGARYQASHSPRLRGQLQPGVAVRLYVTPKSKQIVAVEKR